VRALITPASSRRENTFSLKVNHPPRGRSGFPRAAYAAVRQKNKMETFNINSENTKYDAFISHAREDKESFVSDLANMLKNLGAAIWYDEFSLKIGDSLSKSIDKGLSDSKYGIVILRSI
jgi:hypothetical protein